MHSRIQYRNEECKRLCFVFSTGILNHFTQLQHADRLSILGLPTTTKVLAPCKGVKWSLRSSPVKDCAKSCQRISIEIGWDQLMSSTALDLSSLGVIFAQHWQPGAGRQNAVDDPDTGNPVRRLLHSLLLTGLQKNIVQSLLSLLCDFLWTCDINRLRMCLWCLYLGQAKEDLTVIPNPSAANPQLDCQRYICAPPKTHLHPTEFTCYMKGKQVFTSVSRL